MTTSTIDNHQAIELFKRDVIAGLTSNPKHLDSKYFYDSQGDKLFQQIMASPEYYLTDAELEIFNNRCQEILVILKRLNSSFDFIELGAGDALKSTQLLKCISDAGIDFTYYPIDISGHVIGLIEKELPKKIEGIKIKGIEGEYFSGLREATRLSPKPKLVLFLGGNIGNMPPDAAELFLKELKNCLNPGDLLLIGFDLKKNPWVIFHAYNDSKGITKEFNLNLLRRINRELGADIDLQQFEHYESYDPETGACKSYLISLINQTISICGTEIRFDENEHIFMETSHKYTLQQIDDLALKNGYKVISHLFDSKKWFTAVVWEVC